MGSFVAGRADRRRCAGRGARAVARPGAGPASRTSRSRVYGKDGM